jgi:uncharacterized membrane protein YidH (DUF202 family)
LLEQHLGDTNPEWHGLSFKENCLDRVASRTRVDLGQRSKAIAAAGLGIVVLLGAILHFTRGEGALTPLNFVLAAMAAFVAWGRTQKAPISVGIAQGE